MTATASNTDDTTIPAAWVGMESNYVRNLCALWEMDPKLAAMIEAVHPDDVPALEPAREGGWTAKVRAESGKEVYLHSRYRPRAEAESWAAGLKSDERYAVVIGGFGLGYHIRALWEKMGGVESDVVFIVAESNPAILKAAFMAEDYSAMLRPEGGAKQAPKFFIFTELDRGAFVERVEPRSAMFTAGAGVLLAEHPASQQVAGGYYKAFGKLITEFVSFTRTGFLTLMLNNVTTCRNIANNLGRYATTPPLDLLRDAYAGKPAILVAAGPSLQKNMHLLKEVRSQKSEVGRTRDDSSAVIIAVQTMLKPLLAAGIEPDFVTSLDYNTVSTRFFENLDDTARHVHLVAQPTANWNVLDVFDGTMSLTHHEFAAKLLRDATPPHAALKAGATVAHLSFYLAEFLGCNPIILIGQDLGFVDGLYYKPGTAIHETWGVELGRFNTLETKEWERIARSRLILRKIPDIHGHPMYTEEQFFVYLQQFERDFAASRCRVIDATEGGAKKQGVEVMPLRQAIDQFCTGGRRPPATAWKSWKCDVAGNLRRARAALRARRENAAGMKTTCEQTMPLLQEMLDHQADLPRMDKLFVEVDRLRARVGSDPATFEMVCFLNTIGELRRFQAELTVKKVRNDSVERQRRQLLRDKEYVANLKIGAERLLEILEEALGRIDRQIAAAEAGRPWPRQVAGSSEGEQVKR